MKVGFLFLSLSLEGGGIHSNPEGLLELQSGSLVTCIAVKQERLQFL